MLWEGEELTQTAQETSDGRISAVTKTTFVASLVCAAARQNTLPPLCPNYALVQATTGVGTVSIWNLI